MTQSQFDQPVNVSLPIPLGRTQSTTRLKGSFTPEDIETFRRICSQQLDPAVYPIAASFEKNIPIYSGSQLRDMSRSVASRDQAMDELHRCLLHGPGVFVIRDAVDTRVIDKAEAAFATIIANEKQSGTSKGDHFAPAGANDRIWNSFEKFAMVDPEGFIEYYANEVLVLASEAWLGPGFAMTSQTNIVKPGGKAQEPHRDYHLGFQAEHVASRFPIVSQIASQLLTLQGAVAHTDMPIASGPTQLLPFSQHLDNGYTAYRHHDFVSVFRSHMVQLECAKGDAVFFNPALFHAAGDNTTSNYHRSANLLQVSACWGKPMESVNREKILQTIWEPLNRLKGKLGEARTDAVLQMVCEGYSFPTNLDRDPPPKGGHCPETQLDAVRDGVVDSWTTSTLSERLSALAWKREA